MGNLCSQLEVRDPETYQVQANLVQQLHLSSFVRADNAV